jgi:hypothetical protein
MAPHVAPPQSRAARHRDARLLGFARERADLVVARVTSAGDADADRDGADGDQGSVAATACSCEATTDLASRRSLWE